MIHDQLQNKLIERFHNGDLAHLSNAIQAVIDRHNFYEYFEDDGSLNRNCDLCDEAYPCQTIEDIIKGLS